MEFGFYLYQRGIITSEQLVEAQMLQSDSKLPLGVLAMESGKLDVRDVLSILRVQSDLPQDRFGDIAVELGLMTRRDLAELLLEQSDRRRRITECLVELDFMTQQQVDEELAAFRRDRERRGSGRVQRVVKKGSTPAEILQQAATR
ncbi:hypothetical protein [Aeoliella mucimassa]|uniref:Bacteriophage N4 adsorption protein B n=1 Tax=Aeoliella mucimassa TaxID=2527972 RepID=A0A518AT97_9BACT|nr:hypothetical protein [Aeoliella mucimassa]QDU57954.1 hypothetical protein Pan181_41780 [Aeoliella mucimassa]